MPSGEFDLIQRYFVGLDAGESVVLGVGDDAALMRLPAGSDLVTSVDTQVADVHFPPDSLPEHVGYRAVAAAASDLVAMGAEPNGMLLSLTLPEVDDLWLRSFAEGVGGASRRLRLPLVGGDLTRGPLTIGITALGSVPSGKGVVRGGARVGDQVCVTGTLGDAAAGLALLQEPSRFSGLAPEDIEYLEFRFHEPTPRFDQVPFLREQATAAIDVSDGLLADCAHLARASGVCITLDVQSLPLSPALTRAAEANQVRSWALTGGDDYEVVFTLPATTPPPDGCCVIGRVEAGAGVVCPGFEGVAPGFDHFG